MDNYFKNLSVFKYFMLFFLFYVITGVFMMNNITSSLYINIINILFYVVLYILIFRIPLTKEDRKKIKNNPKDSKIKPLLLVAPFFILNLSSVIYIQILNFVDSSLVDKYLQSPNLSSNFELFEDPLKTGLLFLVIVIMAPIVEELIFRGVLFNLLNKNMKTLTAMIISSLFFGILHSQTFIPTAIIGFLICFIYQKSGNIRYSILAHMFNNFIAFIMPFISGFIETNDQRAMYFGLVIIVLDIFFASYVINYFRKNKEYLKIGSPIKRMTSEVTN